jgi:hypothetical protein
MTESFIVNTFSVHMANETKSAVVQLRMAPSLKAAAEKAAADDHRSLTSLVEKLLTDHIRDIGASPRKPAKPQADAVRTKKQLG